MQKCKKMRNISRKAAAIKIQAEAMLIFTQLNIHINISRNLYVCI